MSASTRRRFLQVTGSAIAVGLAGCAGGEDGQAEEPTDETATQEPTATESPPGTQTGTQTDTPQATPGAEGGDHWHGKLLVEVDGVRMDFKQSRYYGADRYFHFHEDEPRNLWHNEDRVVTFEYALDSVPGLSYEERGTETDLTIHDTTYSTADADTTIRYQQRDVEVDPSTYELADGDILWVLVNTTGAEPTPSSGDELNTTPTNATATNTTSTTPTDDDTF